MGTIMDIVQKLAALPDDAPLNNIRVLGIDLGTTNSTAAEVIWKPGEMPVCNVL